MAQNNKTLNTWGSSYSREALLFKMESSDWPAESSNIFSFSKEKVGECMSVCVCVFMCVCVCLEGEASIQDPDTDNFIKY